MSPSPSWIDDDELQALGQAAREAAGAVPPARGPAPAPAQSAARPPRPSSAPPPAGEPQARRGPSHGPAHSDPVAPSSHAHGASLDSVETKVELLAGWLRTLFQDRPFFLADREGLPIWAERVEANQVVTAPVLERALRSLRALQGGQRPTSARLDWEDGRCLEVLWQNTRLGGVAVGVLGAEPLTQAQKRWIAQALEKVFQP